MSTRWLLRLLTTLRTLPRDLLDALRFLSRLWLPGPPTLRGPGEAAAAFPLAGASLGLLLVAADTLLAQTRLPALSRDILLLLLLLLLTGGLHLDGLMDTCDGLWGGHTVERRLEIMSDSRVGSYGALGGASILLLKLAGLTALSSIGREQALILAPLYGRWALLLAAASFPSARPTGLGAAFRAALTPARLTVAALTSVLLTLLLAGLSGLLTLLGISALAWLAAAWIAGKINGLTGDSYGAILELTEGLSLLLLALWS